MFCKKCGKEIDEGWSTCPNCGEKIKQESADNADIGKKRKAKKPFYKKWWFILIVVIVIIVAATQMSGGGDADGSDTSKKTEDTDNSDTVQQEEDVEDVVEEEAASGEYSTAELYSMLQDNDVMPYQMSVKSEQFIIDHEDFFPTTNYEYIASMIDTSIEYRHVEKNSEAYGEKLMELQELYVLSISETDLGEGNMFTEIEAVDVQDNSYYILYNGSLDFFKEDIVKAVILPMGFTSYDNIGGGTTNALVAAGSYIIKIDSAVE